MSDNVIDATEEFKRRADEAHEPELSDWDLAEMAETADWYDRLEADLKARREREKRGEVIDDLPF
jgi:hypothetical protein